MHDNNKEKEQHNFLFAPSNAAARGVFLFAPCSDQNVLFSHLDILFLLGHQKRQYHYSLKMEGLETRITHGKISRTDGTFSGLIVSLFTLALSPLSINSASTLANS